MIVPFSINLTINEQIVKVDDINQRSYDWSSILDAFYLSIWAQN